MQPSNGNVVIRDVPYALWIFGLVFGGIGIYMATASGAPVVFSIIFCAVGALIILLIPILTVRIDRNSGMLSLTRRGILVNSHQDIRIKEISDVYVDRKVSSDSDGTSVTYQINIVLESGEQVPLRRYYSSGYRRKESQAQLLRDAIGLADKSRGPASFSIGVPQASPVETEESAAAAQGAQETASQQTDGVQWEIQTLTFAGTSITRWFSADVETPGYFVYIAQKQEGQGDQKGIMNLMGKMLFKQSLKMYGFDESYTPGIDTAEIFQEGDRRLLDEYFVFASSTRDAYRILNPWVISPLMGWAERYPLSKTEQQFSQMTVLYSPYGFYISVLGGLNPDETVALTDLGIELVKSSTP